MGGVAVQDSDAHLNLSDLRPKSRAMMRWLNSFMQCIFVSTRLLRWYPLQFGQSARPRHFDARSASFVTMAPVVVGFHG
jgi:hypothetical protein